MGEGHTCEEGVKWATKNKVEKSVEEKNRSLTSETSSSRQAQGEEARRFLVFGGRKPKSQQSGTEE
jgi:pyruvate/2-oxoglutarate dehydrogenase complex dihydrolipoamide dehydrogenase (E3) component